VADAERNARELLTHSLGWLWTLPEKPGKTTPTECQLARGMHSVPCEFPARSPRHRSGTGMECIGALKAFNPR